MAMAAPAQYNIHAQATAPHPVPSRSTKGSVRSTAPLLPPPAPVFAPSDMEAALGSEPLNVQDANGFTPVAWAVCLGNVPALRVLLQSGAIVDLPNGRGQTPLHLACLNVDHNTDAIVRLLLDAGASCSARDSEQSTPLMYACRKGSVAVVRALLQAGADVGIHDGRGMTAFMHACSQNCVDILDALLEGDHPSINDQDQTGWSALHWACAVGSRDCVARLVSVRRLKILTAFVTEETPLHFAARHGWSEICTILLLSGNSQAGLSLLFKCNAEGLTAIEVAHRFGRHDCLACLYDLRRALDQRYRMDKGIAASASPSIDDLGQTSPSTTTLESDSADDAVRSDSTMSGSMASLVGVRAAPTAASVVPDARGRKRSPDELGAPSHDASEAGKQRRREYMRNRRQQERDEISTLEVKVSQLEDENTRLASELSRLRAQAAKLRGIEVLSSV